MATEKEYFAFISYQREDEEWAKWLAHELEHYHFPVTLNGRKDLPKDLRPIFRDIDELSAGNLPNQIHKALANSKHLIVICSPRSAQSKWVNKEIEEFINMNKTDKIFPFIIDGKANAEKETDECFPPALRNLPREEERLGGNINEMGRDAAVVKIVAGMLDLDFDILWQRYEREKAEEERKIKEQRDNLLKVQSRFLSEKANAYTLNFNSYYARLLALEAIPEKLNNPSRPYVPEAEFALRKAAMYNDAVLKGHKAGITDIAFSPDGNFLLSCSRDKTIKMWDINTGVILNSLKTHSVRFPHSFFRPKFVFYSPNGKLAAFSDGSDMIIWDLQTSSKQKEISLRYVGSFSIWAEFSPDNMELLISDSEYIRIWDFHNNKKDYEKTFPNRIETAHYSKSGNTIYIIFKNGSVKKWNPEDQLINTLVNFEDETSRYPIISNDRQILALKTMNVLNYGI